MEIKLEFRPPTCRSARRSRQAYRAAWWFAQMRQAVDRVGEHETNPSKPEARPEFKL